MDNSRKSLEDLQKVLAIEKKEDFEQFKMLIERLPLQKRKEKGFTWYPVNSLKAGYTFGDRAFVIVERTTDLQESHQFRSGKIVRLFNAHHDGKKAEKNGVIHFVDKRKMKIILNSKDLPDWLNTGLLGVDLLFDERTYVEMEKAMNTVLKAKQGRLAELREVLLGTMEPRFFQEHTPIQISHLNDSQNAAVNKILSAQDVAVVHGPPGTGKTTTLVHAIQKLAQREHTILVTAPSNTAVDLLTERLAEKELMVVRVGNISRVDESIIRHTLEARLAEHPENKNIKKVRIQAAEARKKARKYRRNFGKEEAFQRRSLYQEAGELESWANQLEDRLLDQILSAAQVITCTLVGASNKVLEKRKFRTLVIDEAAQALEPATWIPITKASKLVLAGDPYQLPPTVKAPEAKKKGLDITLIEKLIRKWTKVNLLNVQYRMHQSIMEFSNQQFYGGQLQADESVRNHTLTYEGENPMTFIDTVGCGFEEKVHPEYKSRYNPDEFQILCEHLYQLLEPYEADYTPNIGIISPYREQVEYITDALQEDPLLKDRPITVNTIDGFQGQEREVIYISLVRSNSKSQIGFLKDTRRMNVAMTRAKKLLVIIGDSGTIGRDKFYEKFLNYVEEHGLYRTAWEFMKT